MNEYIVKEIENYMNNPLKYAILLEGNWGSGKTFFIENEIKNEKIYISLNGISNLKNLSMQLAYQLIGKKLVNKDYKVIKKVFRKEIKEEDIDDGSEIAGAVGTVIATFLESKINISFSELVNLLKNVDLQDKLIVFDDLERCSIPLDEILGFINTLVEHNEIKVLIVANEEELNKKGNYEKIKEKLIYQTFKYTPDLEKIYDTLIEKNKEYDCEEIRNNKSFFINELKRKNHCNIRTMQFIFQRYTELKKYITAVLEKVNCSEEIKKQINVEIFKYMVVIARDYKMGEILKEFKDGEQISYYKLINNSYFSIPSFKFVNDFIKGFQISIDTVDTVLKQYIDEIKTDIHNKNSSLNILERWWECEDDEILSSIEKILKGLKENVYDVSVYLKILSYFVKLTTANFPEKILLDAIEYMKNNINQMEEHVFLECRMLNTNFNKTEEEKFGKLKNELIEIVETHNSNLNQMETCIVKEKEVGKLGTYFYDWCEKHRDNLMSKKKFLKEVGINNVIYIAKNGNAKDIRFLIYLFNEIYNYANVKELYPNDGFILEKLLDELEKIDIKEMSKMKQYSFMDFKEDIVIFKNKLK